MSSTVSKLSFQAVNGTLWVFIERIFLELFRFVTTIILARLLGPKEFGLIALTSIFITISIAFIDSGFTKALIQKKETSLLDESTIFFFNLSVSIFFVIVINIFASQIAIYFNEPRFENVLRALSITLILFALRQIQQVILTKQLNFKLQFKANVIGTVLSGILGIILAYCGWGVWALVFQSIAEGIFKGLMYWLVSNWRPMFVFSIASFKRFYKFGINLFFNDLLKSISENMYGLLIGRYYNSTNLGLYDRSNKLASLVITNFQFSIQRVTFPLFSKVQDNKDLLKETVRKSLDLIMFMVIPAMVLLAVVAKPLTIVLLSSKWLEMVPYIQLFCIYWVFFPFSGVNNHVILAMGKPNIIFKQSILIYGLQIVILISTMRISIYAIIFGQIVATIGRQIILVFFSKKLINFGFIQQFGIFFKHLSLAFIAGISVYFLDKFIDNNYLLLLTQLGIGFFTYFILSYIFNRNNILFIFKFLKEQKDKFRK